MQIITQTARVIIRQFAPNEKSLFIDVNQDERVTRFVTPRTYEENRDLFDQMQIDYITRPEFGRWGLFSIEDNSFIGICMLIGARPGLTGMELGYLLHYDYWNKGYATEVVKGLVDYGFYNQGLDEICAITNPENLASQRVLIKAGFTNTEMVFMWDTYNPLFVIKHSKR